MQELIRFYRLLSNLSIDVACGSVVLALFFADVFRSAIKPHGLAVLFLTVWVIYTTDHLIDSRNVKHEASSNRHQFHQRHFRTIAVFVVVAVCVIILLLFFVRTPIVLSGMVLAMLVVVYLLINQLTSSFKEFLVAMLYTCGVALPAFAVSARIMSTESSLFIMEVFLLAWINLLLFSLYDQYRDRRDGFSSFVVIHGEKFSLTVLALLFVVLAAVLLYHLIALPSLHAFVIMMMALTLAAIFIFRKTFADSDRYRFVGDLIFLYPLFLWI